MISKDSLSGQNSLRRQSGRDSSSLLSTNLFKKLRELDRKITELDNIIRLRSYGNWSFKNNVLINKRTLISGYYKGNTETIKLVERRQKLDQKRKEIRIKRKLNKRIENNS